MKNYLVRYWPKSHSDNPSPSHMTVVRAESEGDAVQKTFQEHKAEDVTVVREMTDEDVRKYYDCD